MINLFLENIYNLKQGIVSNVELIKKFYEVFANKDMQIINQDH